MKRKRNIFAGCFIAALFVFFGLGATVSTAVDESMTISGTISCNLPAGDGEIYVVVFDGPDPETSEVIGETSISAPGAYTVNGLPTIIGQGYVFAYWDMDGAVAPEGPVTGDYQGEYEENPISLSPGSVSGVDLTLTNDWVINWGTDGVYDTDEATEGVQNDTVTNILQLTTGPGHGDVQCWGDYPWSPDGSQIVYTCVDGESPPLPSTTGETFQQICVINADGSGFDQLTSDATCHSQSSFTPDGTGIVFQKEVAGEGRTEIWIMDADGTNPQNLTEAHESPLSPGESLVPSESNPVVSPDGTKIAFMWTPPAINAPAYTPTGVLSVMNIDGTEVVDVSGSVEAPTKYSWSPDSEWILFSGKSPTYTGRSRIYKVQPDGSQDPVMLSDDGVTTEYICENWAFWSPDGNHIAYHTRTSAPVAPAVYENSIHTLSMMDTDGTNKVPLVTENGSGDWDTVCAPKSWSPDSQWIAFKKYVEVEAESGTAQYVPESDYSSIFIININDSEDIRQLTDGYLDLRLWWSPDGGKILFKDDENSRDEDCDTDLLLINLAPWFLEEAQADDLVNGTVGGETDEVQNPDAGTIVQATEMADGGRATIVTAKYGENPTGISFSGEFYDLYIDDPSGILGEIVYTIYFTGDAQAPYWFDGDTWQEFDEADYEIFTEGAPYEYQGEDYDGYIEITLTNDTIPSISDFTGTTVGLGTPEGESSSGCFVESLLN